MKNHLSISACISSIALLSCIPSALALSPVQIAQIAKQTTVQITKCERGAGVIIQKNGNTYQVLTVAQAVKKPGCELVAPDGNSYRVDRVQAFPDNIDLAVISFTSNKNYPVATIDNSDRVTAGAPIYISNFTTDRAIDPAAFKLATGTKIGNSSKQLNRGYSFIYSHNIPSGASGNPMWNDRGETIAIQGQGDLPTQRSATSPNVRVQTEYHLGIGMNTFAKFAAAAGIRGYTPAPAATKPTPVEDLIASAIQNERKGDYRGMLADLEQGIFLDSQNPRLYYSRGVAKSMLNNQDAIADYNFAIALNLRDASIYNNRGVAKAEFGDKKGAIADYRQAIAIDPNYADPYYNRGQIAATAGDKKAALSDFDRAIALNPNFERAYLSRGMIKSTLGDKKGEIDDLNRAIALAPNYTEAYHQRGLARLSAGDNNGAIVDFNKTIALNPNPEVYNARGDAKAQIGDNNGAIADYSSAIVLNPSSARAYANRGAIQSKLGDKKAALLDLKKAANRYKQQKQTASYQKVITEIKRLSS